MIDHDDVVVVVVVDIVAVVVITTMILLLPILSREEIDQIDQKEVNQSKELVPSRIGVHKPVIDGPSPPWSVWCGGQGSRCGSGSDGGHDDGSGSGRNINDVVVVVGLVVDDDDSDLLLLSRSKRW